MRPRYLIAAAGFLGIFAVVLAVSSVAMQAEPLEGGKAELEITVWPQGSDGPAKTRTLRCPAVIDEPEVEFCKTLLRLPSSFAPLPPGFESQNCPSDPAKNLPMEALVSGSIEGNPIGQVRYRWDNACQASRFAMVTPILQWADPELPDAPPITPFAYPGDPGPLPPEGACEKEPPASDIQAHRIWQATCDPQPIPEPIERPDDSGTLPPLEAQP